MIRSRPLEIGGRFVGIAVQSATDWHLVAVDPRLGDIHGARFPSAEEAARVARLVLIREAGPPSQQLAVPRPA